MSNSISFVGRLGNDAELKNVGDYTVLEFSIANNVGFGEKQATNWFRCAVWGKQATSLEPYLKKGKQVYVNGELTIRSYEHEGITKQSNDLRVNNIDLVGSREDSNTSGDSAPAPAPAEAPKESGSGDFPF